MQRHDGQLGRVRRSLNGPTIQFILCCAWLHDLYPCLFCAWLYHSYPCVMSNAKIRWLDGLWMAWLPNLSEGTSPPICWNDFLLGIGIHTRTVHWKPQIRKYPQHRIPMGERHLCTAVADSLTALTRWRRFVLRTSTAAIITLLAKSSNALGTA